MAVPEAAMDKQNRGILWQDQIRPAGKVASVEPKAEAAPVKS